MKAVITVVGTDRIGIIAGVSNTLADDAINILDISQTILGDYFTMMMLVDLSAMKGELDALKERLSECGERLGVSIQIQHEEIFRTMHRI